MTENTQDKSKKVFLKTPKKLSKFKIIFAVLLLALVAGYSYFWNQKSAEIKGKIQSVVLTANEFQFSSIQASGYPFSFKYKINNPQIDVSQMNIDRRSGDMISAEYLELEIGLSGNFTAILPKQVKTEYVINDLGLTIYNKFSNHPSCSLKLDSAVEPGGIFANIEKIKNITCQAQNTAMHADKPDSEPIFTTEEFLLEFKKFAGHSKISVETKNTKKTQKYHALMDLINYGELRNINRPEAGLENIAFEATFSNSAFYSVSGLLNQDMQTKLDFSNDLLKLNWDMHLITSESDAARNYAGHADINAEFKPGFNDYIKIIFDDILLNAGLEPEDASELKAMYDDFAPDFDAAKNAKISAKAQVNMGGGMRAKLEVDDATIKFADGGIGLAFKGLMNTPDDVDFKLKITCFDSKQTAANLFEHDRNLRKYNEYTPLSKLVKNYDEQKIIEILELAAKVQGRNFEYDIQRANEKVLINDLEVDLPSLLEQII